MLQIFVCAQRANQSQNQLNEIHFEWKNTLGVTELMMNKNYY